MRSRIAFGKFFPAGYITSYTDLTFVQGVLGEPVAS